MILKWSLTGVNWSWAARVTFMEKWFWDLVKLDTEVLNWQRIYELHTVQVFGIERQSNVKGGGGGGLRGRGSLCFYSKSGLTEWPLIAPDRKGYKNSGENGSICHLPASYKLYCVDICLCLCVWAFEVKQTKKTRCIFFHPQNIANKSLSIENKTPTIFFFHPH